MPNSPGQRKPKASVTAGPERTVLGQVLVIDGVEEWRQFISKYLDNQGYAPTKCCDLPAATEALKIAQGLAGICLDLRFAAKESVATAAGKMPELPPFLDRLRQRHSDVPMLIISDDEEAGHSAANGLNLVGLHAAFITKDVQELNKALPDAIHHVFRRKHSVQIEPLTSKRPENWISDLAIPLGILTFGVVTSLAGLLVTLHQNGVLVVHMFFVFLALIFLLCGALILTYFKKLSGKDLKQIIKDAVIHLNPLRVSKHGKQDRDPDNETK